MNLESSMLNLSEMSVNSDCPDIEDPSFHDLDASLALTEDGDCSINHAKLSITLDSEERKHLKQRKGRNVPINSTFKNGSNVSQSESTLQGISITTQEMSIVDREGEEKSQISLNKDETGISDTSNTLLGDSIADMDESVIPIEDDDDEEDEEASENPSESRTLNDTKTSVKSLNSINNMFSHLQEPNETVDKTETETQMEVDEVLDGSPDKVNLSLALESYVEEEEVVTSVLTSDENSYFQKSLIELGRRLWSSSAQEQNYTKGCLWSPDGTCLLVPVHLDGMHVMELPTDIYTTQELDTEREVSDLTSAVHVKEGGMVYDVAWFPFMTSTDPATCCWLATRQHEPIHMWDAFTGELRCSYRGYDDVDEVESAISIAFSNDGQKVVGGYKKTIKIFDTNIPGRDYTSIRVKQAISCMAFTTENDNCVTTGSWNSHIYHYDLRAPKLGPLFTLGGHKGGITWLKYSTYNTDNWYLFSGARMDDKILQWDMRNYQEPVKSYERKVQTNQRIYFDLSPMQKWLISGDTEGSLRIWDMDGKEEHMEIPIHLDCCNGVSFHPSLPIVATSSGQFHFLEKPAASLNTRVEMDDEIIINYENSVFLLWFGPQKL